jgi:peptidyl-tRNA hydrolase
VADYVLKPPKQSERTEIDRILERAQDIIPDWLSGDFAQAVRVLHAKG